MVQRYHRARSHEIATSSINEAYERDVAKVYEAVVDQVRNCAASMLSSTLAHPIAFKKVVLAGVSH